jgi:2-keto-3-deoxy-L-rhamnonate aldolase RhmA
MTPPEERPSYRRFAERLRAREHLLGTFVKTPTSHATEILGIIGFDFVVFDGEHAPLDLGALDTMILGARASNVAGVVRVRDTGEILSVLDAGAAGVLVPHVDSRDRAETVVAAARYGGGRRGFANTTRAGGFGAAGFADHKAAQDREVAVVAMIEDVEAVGRIDAILAVPGLDAIFVGRGDLTAAIDAPSMTSPETHVLVAPILAAARRVAMPVIMLCPDRADAERMAALGASAWLVSSDHGFMAAAARRALAEFTPPIGSDKGS